MTAFNEREPLFPGLERDKEHLELAALSRAQQTLCDRHAALCDALVAQLESGVSSFEPEFVALQAERQRYDTACQVVYAEIERCWRERDASLHNAELERLYQHQQSLQDWADAHGEDSHAARREQDSADCQWSDEGFSSQ